MPYDKQDDSAPRDKQQLVLSPFPGAVVMHDVDDSDQTIFESLVFRALLIALSVATLVSWIG
jgi:hypothetical protein